MCVSVCVCVFVADLVPAYDASACNKLNLPARSSLNDKGFLVMDFAKKLSFMSSSLFFTFARPSPPFAIH